MIEKKFNHQKKHISKLFSRTIALAKKESGKSIQENNFIVKLKKSQKRCEEQTFLVAIMALAKSGKSTFLNALLGKTFLPISNVPETAVIVKIRHSEKEEHKDGYLYNKGEIVAKGTTGIYSYLKDLNKTRREDNHNLEIDLLLLAPIQALKGKDLGSIKFEMVDTPGFGEAEDEIRQGQTIYDENVDFLNETDIIIYLLDYTKLKTSKEREIIDKLSSIRPNLLEQVQERLFFVVNKIDEANSSQYNLLEEEVVDYVYEILSKDINDLVKNQISTISAYDALLGRLILENAATPEDFSDFANKAFGRRGKKKTLEECWDAARDFLYEDSKLPALEDDIIDFIYNNRGKLLLDSLVEKLESSIKQFNDYIKTAQCTLRVNKRNIEEFEAKVEGIKQKSAILHKKATEHEKGIELFANEEFSSFKKDLIKYLNYKMKAINKRGKERKSNNNKYMSTNQEYINGQIQKEIKNISNYIYRRSTPFIKEYKNKAIYKQKELLEDFNKIILIFIEDLQKVLKTVLDIELTHTEFELPKIDVQAILDRANKELDKFIDTEINKKSETKTKKEGSFCNRKEVNYTVINTYETYEIDTEELFKFWKKEIGEMCDNAVLVTKKIAKVHVKEELEKAKKEFDNYANQYLQIIQKEKDEKVKVGKKYVDERLAELATYKTQLKKIIEGINNYKKYSKESKLCITTED